MLHHIQKRILDQLSHAETLRYTDINPSKLEGNVFTYHLRQLIAAKLVVQNDDKSYSLTERGRAYLVRRFEDELTSAHSIFLIVIRYNDQILLRERLVHPTLGYRGFVHGEPKSDEPLEMTVRQRILEKTGLAITNTEVHGSGLIRIHQNEELQSFSHAIIVSATATDSELLIDADTTGRNYWVQKDHLADEARLLPSCLDIMHFIDSGDAWFDLSYSL
jgi:ADP-ribose pyrophosphatase